MKPSYGVQEVGNHWFATYHPHYKDKLVGNPSRTFVCAANCLYFLCVWRNFSAAFFLGDDGGAWIANQAWLLKRENRQELLYIFFLTLSNLRLSFLAQRPRKCARQCSNAWRCPNARQCLNVKSLSIFLIPPQQLNFCQTMFLYLTSDCSGKSTISPEGYDTSNSAKTPYMS